VCRRYEQNNIYTGYGSGSGTSHQYQVATNYTRLPSCTQQHTTTELAESAGEPRSNMCMCETFLPVKGPIQSGFQVGIGAHVDAVQGTFNGCERK
jgi:hypothetical protein